MSPWRKITCFATDFFPEVFNQKAVLFASATNCRCLIKKIFCIPALRKLNEIIFFAAIIPNGAHPAPLLFSWTDISFKCLPQQRYAKYLHVVWNNTSGSLGFIFVLHLSKCLGFCPNVLGVYQQVLRRMKHKEAVGICSTRLLLFKNLVVCEIMITFWK